MDLVKIRDLLNSAAQSDDLKQCRALVKQALAEAIAALQPGGEREELADKLDQLAGIYLREGSSEQRDVRNAAALLRAPAAVTVADAAIDGAFRTALILAHNICVQDSDRYNADDQIEEANALATVAKRIGGYGAMDHTEILSLMEEAGQKPAALSAALAGEVG